MATNYSGTFNTNPYYDDFDDAKNYHRILFRPGYAVQARELTQLQTQLQDQLKKFGNHVFTNGSVVLGGGVSFEKDLLSIKLNSSYSGTSINVNNFLGKTITGATSGTKAIVKFVIDQTSTDPITILVKVTSGTDFTVAEDISATSGSTTYNARIQSTLPFNSAMIYSMQSGVFYVDGKFVYAEQQTIALDKYTNTSSKKIGFTVEETIVNTDDDESLLDGSLGTSNYAAPGADRYKVALTLTSQDLGILNAGSFVIGETYKIETVGSTNWTLIGAETNTVGTIFVATDAGSGTGTASVYSTKFIEIARVVSGELVVAELKTIYSEIGKELANRTFDESGDYTVKKWPIQIVDHPSDETKFNVLLDPGKAYVKGYEFRTDNQSTLTLNKARTTQDVTSSSVSVAYGSFVYVTSLYGSFIGNTTDSTLLADQFSTVELHNVARASVSGGTTKIGSANVRYVNLSVGDPGLTGIYRMYLFNITMDTGFYFADTESIVIRSGATVLSGANIDDRSKIGGVSGGDVLLSGSDSPGLVFPLNNTFIETVKDSSNNNATNYTIQRTFKVNLSGTSPGVIYTNTANEAFEGTAGTIVSDTIADASYHVVLTSVTNNGGVSAFTAGSVVDFSDGAGVGRYIELSTIGTTQSASFYFTGVSVAFSAVAHITATINVSSQAAKTKTLSNYLSKVLGVGLNTTIGGSDSLSVSDVYDLLAVYNTGTINPNGGVTSLSSGIDAVVTTIPVASTATFPTSGTITIDTEEITYTGKTSVSFTGCTRGANSTTAATHLSSAPVSGETVISINSTTGAVTWNGISYTDVTSDYIFDNGQRAEIYDHANLVLNGTAPGSSDYIIAIYRKFAHSADSGFFSVDSYTDSGLDYVDYPTFTDPATGIVYNLRDSIDFRPKRDDDATTFSGGQIPSPYESLLCDYSFYLARFDKIIATVDKQFVVKEGIPSLKPVVPVDDTNGMSIYVLGIAPYTGNVTDVQVKYIDNKRYTMRDIGRLEKRISNLEYYTQLSLLEKQAKDTSIPDASLYEKFKNGFAVDPFTSQDIFINENTWSQRKWAWWNAWFNGSTTLNSGALNYSENTIADPGNIDFNAAIDPVNQEMRSPFTVEFHEFEYTSTTGDNTYKTGDLVTLEYTESTVVTQNLATSWVNVNPFNVIKFLGTITLNPSFDRWVETEFLPSINKIVDVQMPDAADLTVWGTISGSGNAVAVTGSTTRIDTNVLGSTTASLGTNVVDVQYIPFIRESTILGVGKSFKPKAELFPFIDTDDISTHCRPMTLLTVQYSTGRFNDSHGVYEPLEFKNALVDPTAIGSARCALYSQSFTSDATKNFITIYDESGTISVGDYVIGTVSGFNAVITAKTTYTLGDALVPDEYGNIGFEFQCPAGTYKTGERTIRLIDNSTNDIELQESIGEAKYNAQGIVQTKQETILTTRSIQRQRVTTLTGVRYRVDPTAETFFVDAIDYPQGFHVSSVDLYFRTKSSVVPVEVQIRRTVNGYPSSIHDIPFAEVVMPAYRVNTSTDGKTATNFKFDNPVYLPPGEYAIVILSNSNEYNVYVAEMNEPLLDNSGRVDKQPYTGALFQSQNASTWNADQNKDLKFKLNRAVFSSTGTAQFDILEPSLIKDYQTLFINASSFTPPGTQISWEAKAWYGSSVYDTNWVPVDINQDINYQSLKRVGPRSSSVDNPALKLRATLVSEKNTVSPTIDAASISCVIALNSINNDSTGESGAKSGGNAIAKYITKPISLASGFEATNLNVTFDAYKPSGTDIKVYYKALPFESVSPIFDENWTEMVIENPVGFSTTLYDFKEHRFFPSGAFDVYGVPQDSPIAARFNAFQIKIVLLSSSQALSPRVRDLRIIALDS